MSPRRIAVFARNLSVAAGLLVPSMASAVSADPVIIDGSFDEWKSRPASLVDPEDAPRGPIDLRAIKVHADGRFLNIMIETTRPACLQGLDGRLELVLDADGRADTGTEANGVPGVDLAVVFSPNYTNRQGETLQGNGVGLRITGIDEAATPTPYAYGVQFAPTYAADRIEIRLERGTPLPGALGPILAGDSATISLFVRTVDDRILDEAAPIRVALPELDLTPPTPPSEVADGRPFERRPDSFRVMSWNAERGVIVRQRAASERIIGSVRPDIILLQELTEDIAPATLERMFDAASGLDWTVSIGRGGGNLRSGVATWLPGARITELDPLGLIDEPDRSIRTAAMLVRHDGGSVLAISVHLKCCGKPGDSSDRRRIDEADAIRAAVARAVAEHDPDTVVIGGDMNLVGTYTPLGILLDGTDSDGSELVPVDALQPGPGRSNATWFDEGRFTPGRLDWILVGDRAVKPVWSIVLNDAEMASDGWFTGPLRRGDTAISDHFPVVVDLEWRNPAVPTG